MKPLYPVPLSPVTLAALRSYLTADQREAKEIVLNSERIESSIREGVKNAANRTWMQFAGSTKDIVTAGGGWDRSQ